MTTEPTLGASAVDFRRSEAPKLETPREHVPHVIAWNLTRRCNLECAHCYIAAGPHESATSELSTAECLRIAREILALNPSPLFILSGGEPLLRTDLERIAENAKDHGATVVVGTNGTLLDDRRSTNVRFPVRHDPATIAARARMRSGTWTRWSCPAGSRSRSDGAASAGGAGKVGLRLGKVIAGRG